jgi:hypothetical protein
VQLWALVTDVSQAPTTLAQWVQSIESVVEALHAPLAAARHGVAPLTQQRT